MHLSRYAKRHGSLPCHLGHGIPFPPPWLTCRGLRPARTPLALPPLASDSHEEHQGRGCTRSFRSVLPGTLICGHFGEAHVGVCWEDGRGRWRRAGGVGVVIAILSSMAERHQGMVAWDQRQSMSVRCGVCTDEAFKHLAIRRVTMGFGSRSKAVLVACRCGTRIELMLQDCSEPVPRREMVRYQCPYPHNLRWTLQNTVTTCRSWKAPRRDMSGRSGRSSHAASSVQEVFVRLCTFPSARVDWWCQACVAE